MLTFLQYSELKIGSQNVSRYDSGAYTGETSAKMLKLAGCSLSIIGHSERRAMFAENNVSCREKILTSLNHGLLPVLCIGETREEREADTTKSILLTQLSECLHNIDLTDKDICIAYEPVWAIGTGLAATPEIVQDVHCFIRKELTRLYNAPIANRARIVYGGSVSKNNTTELLKQADIDGLLVGGASLDPGHFLAICEQASEQALA